MLFSPLSYAYAVIGEVFLYHLALLSLFIIVKSMFVIIFKKGNILDFLTNANLFLLNNHFLALGLVVLSFILGFYAGLYYANLKSKIGQEFKLSCDQSPNKRVVLKTINSKLIFNSCPHAKDLKFCKKLNDKCILKDHLLP